MVGRFHRAEGEGAKSLFLPVRLALTIFVTSPTKSTLNAKHYLVYNLPMGIRWGLVFFAICSGAFSEAPIEFWLHRPTIKLSDVQNGHDRGDMLLSKEPKIQALGVKDTLHLKGFRFDSDRLRLDSAAASLLISELVASQEVLGQKIALFSFRDVRISAEIKRPLEIVLPHRIELQLVANPAGGFRFEVLGTALKDYLSAQVDKNVREDLFSVSVSGGLSDLALRAANEFLNQQKGELLKLAKEELKKSLTSDSLNQLFSLADQVLAGGLSPEALAGKWFLQKQGADWRLSPENAAGRPVPSVGLQNRLSVLLSPDFVQKLFERELKTPLEFHREESETLAVSMGLTTSDFKLVGEGPRGPKVKFWSARDGKGQTRNFVDLLLCFSTPQGEEGHLGAVIELSQGGVPEVRNVVLLNRPGADGIGKVNKAPPWLIEALSSRVLESFKALQPSRERLVLANARASGVLGPRQKASPSGGNWADHLVLEFTVQ